MKKFNPPLIFFSLFIISFIVSFLLPRPQLIPAPFHYLGAVFIFLGAHINIVSDRLFKLHQTPIKPYQKPNFLITSGPYKISRNPMYLGMFLLLFGLAIYLQSAFTLLVPIIFIIFIQKYFIPIEETNLKKQFGQKYQQYQKKVRRWL